MISTVLVQQDLNMGTNLGTNLTLSSNGQCVISVYIRLMKMIMNSFILLTDKSAVALFPGVTTIWVFSPTQTLTCL